MPQRTTRRTASLSRGLWSTIPSPNRRWVIINALGVSAAINVMVNLAIAWLSTRGALAVPLWSTPLLRPSTIVDTMGTTFMLPLITAITCGAALGREIGLGRIPPLPLDCEARKLLSRLPRGLVPRALQIASLTLVVIGPLAILALVAARFGNVGVSSFLVFKVAYAVGLGLIVTPVIALASMVHEEPPTGGHTSD